MTIPACPSGGLSDASYTSRIPASLEFTGERSALQPRGSADDKDMPPIKTFLVEDSPVIRSNLVAALEDLAPVQVVGFAESASDACDRLREHQALGDCDLVIVDVFLKSGSGLDVLRCLRDHNATTQRVVLTNYATPEIRKECLALGALAVFDKSQDFDALVDFCNDIAPA